MNSVDALVRHAASLQQTADVADGAVHINQALAQKLGVSDQGRVKVEQDEHGVEMDVVIDDTIAGQTVLIQGAHAKSAELGPWYGDVHLSRI